MEESREDPEDWTEEELALGMRTILSGKWKAPWQPNSIIEDMKAMASIIVTDFFEFNFPLGNTPMLMNQKNFESTYIFLWVR